MEPTLKQTKEVVQRIDDAGLTRDAMQFLLEGGLYTDLLRYAGNKALRMCRDQKKLRLEIQKILGLSALFATPKEQLETFLRINRVTEMGFEEYDVSLLPMPTEETFGLVTWTLEVMLDTPGRTFEVVRRLIRPTESDRTELPSSCRISGVAEGCDWIPNCARWVKIDLGADLGVSPKEGTGPYSAHIGPMWQAVYSPNWFRNIGSNFMGVDIPEVSLPGFRLDYTDDGGVPHLEPIRIRQHSLDRSYTNLNKGQAALARYV